MRLSFLLLLTILSCQVSLASPPPKHEIRGVWITTIYGLDWPTRPATTEAGWEQQKKELEDILDKLKKANFNTVFLQVRLRGDVIYPSSIEPVNAVFSGKAGVRPGYDPLAFAIEACHKRGLECHAWFVTFPLGTDRSVRLQGNSSVVKRRPELCKRHNGEWYLDPGASGTADYLLSLVKELVAGYDIDGIHLDYIRYPEQASRFPDKSLHNKYGKNKKLADWRRENINQLVYRLYDAVKEEKPWVQVSSAPLGKYSRIEKVPHAGWTAYESVYQDPQQWIKDGKHDMVAPMMYYQHDNFFPFVDDWVDNSNGRLIVPGLGAYRMLNKEGDWKLTDITEQIDYSRSYGAAGCAFFRSTQVTDNMKGLYEKLVADYYTYPALLPPLHWLSDSIPPAPEEMLVEKEGDQLKLSWKKTAEEANHTYTIYYAPTDSVRTDLPQHILATGIRGTTFYLPVDTTTEMGLSFCITTSNRYHIESQPSRETYYYLTPHIK